MIHIAGHLGADPEARFTSSGKKVTTLRVATHTRRGGQDDTIWWRVTIWGDQFDKMLPHFKKGSPIMAFGEIHKPEIFNDREGKPQISMEITAVSIQFSPFGRPEKQGEAAAARPAADQPAAAAPVNPYMAGMPKAAPMGQTIDDEVPF